MWDFPAYGSHIPVLCRCFIELRESNGNVLELGVGNFSTVFLHELCANRNLLSLDVNEEWIGRVKYLSNYHHAIRKVDSWKELSIYDMKWDIAFIDQSPGEYRKHSIEALANNAKLIVCHDTENWDNVYGYKFILPSFKYLVEYKQHFTTTMVVSNFIDVNNWWKEK